MAPYLFFLVHIIFFSIPIIYFIKYYALPDSIKHGREKINALQNPHGNSLFLADNNGIYSHEELRKIVTAKIVKKIKSLEGTSNSEIRYFSVALYGIMLILPILKWTFNEKELGFDDEDSKFPYVVCMYMIISTRVIIDLYSLFSLDEFPEEKSGFSKSLLVKYIAHLALSLTILPVLFLYFKFTLLLASLFMGFLFDGIWPDESFGFFKFL
jgi:hypothetical protein